MSGGRWADSMISGMNAPLLLLQARRPAHFALPPWILAIWLGFFLLFLVMVAAKFRALKKRRAAMEQLGMEIGFAYSRMGDEALATELGKIQISGNLGTARYGNVLRGSAGGGDAIIADRTVGTGKTQSTSTVVGFNLKTALPSFLLCEENVLWHIAEKLGYKDIDIDGAPDFSKRFFLHGNDEAAIRALFKPELTQVLEGVDSKTHLYATGGGSWVVLYERPGVLMPVEKIRGFLQQAEIVANAFRRACGASVFG